MGLKFTDALKLSVVNILEHKGRTAATVLTISVLFGFLMGVNFLLNGLEGTLYDAAVENTGGLAYLQLGHSKGGAKYIFDEAEELDFDKVVMKEKARGAIVERVKANGGELVGRGWTYQVNYPYQIVELAAVKDFVTGDLTQVPEGKIPVLMGENGWNLDNMTVELKEYYERVKEGLYEVGTVPSMTESGLDTEQIKLLKPLLAGYSGGVGEFLVVDDGSGRVEKYLYDKSREYVEEQRAQYVEYACEGVAEGCYFQAPNIGVTGQFEVATFDTMEKVAGYVLPESFMGMVFYTGYFPFSSQSLINNPVSIVQMVTTYKTMIKFLEVVMLVVAVIVATLTFMHLVDQDAATVALYRSLGATTGQIYLIYFLYMVEMCLLAVVMCFVMAFALTGIVALIDGSALSVALEKYYMLSRAPAVRLFRFDKDFWTVIVAIMLVAPLGFGFSTGRFSNKNIAKKLKDD